MTRAKFYFHILFIYLISFTLYAEDTAKLIFAQSSPMVLQVKVIDKASGNKSTIGSGFQVSAAGVIATNYHVVSDYVLDHEKYTIEVLDHNDRAMDASLINFDIVHDLALLKVNKLEESALNLSQSQPDQGNRIYSMGNPHDLGMTIIEGTYNGLVEGSRYQKYLFSGSLNSGMSGGPVLNNAGDVIGVNVSKGGEQISFLVPVKHLKALMAQGYEPLNVDNYVVHATDDLIKDQDDYYSLLLDMDWATKEFKQFVLPDKIHKSLKCWGHTLEKKERLFDETHRHCKTEDEIYLNSDFFTGAFSFNYESYSSDKLNTSRFYNLLEEKYEISSFSNSDDKEDTTNFVCVTEFVMLNEETEIKRGPWKLTSCVREYIDYKGLYDAGLIAVHADSKDGSHRALKITLLAIGIDKKNITSLHDKFLGSVKWKQ